MEEESVKAAEVAMGVGVENNEALVEIVEEGGGVLEGDSALVTEAQPLDEPEGVLVSSGEKVLLPLSGAVMPGVGVREVVMLVLRVAEGEEEAEGQELALGVI